MKENNRHVWVVMVLLLLSGCTGNGGVIRESDRVNAWIYSSMEECYLWSAQMKPMSQGNLDDAPTRFFEKTIRYRVDNSVGYKGDIMGDRFSYVRNTVGATRSFGYQELSHDRPHAFGFDSRLFIDGPTQQLLYCQVLYVVPGSPAHKAGIKRGEMYNRINEVAMPMTDSQYSSFMALEKISLGMITDDAVKSITRADYYDTPVLFDSVYETQPATAYLVYNHFSGGSGERFNTELSDAFRRFKSKNAENLILDFRYNGGGELSVARLLASLIVRKEMLGRVLMYKEENKSLGNPAAFEPEYFMGLNSVADRNCDFKRIVVLTSGNTASASELIIHVLKRYYKNDLYVIGERTVGKNVGGYKITNKRYEWELSPITLRVYDADKVSGYEHGIESDMKATEFLSGYSIGQFGDSRQERLLVLALTYLHGPQYGVNTRLNAPAQGHKAMVFATTIQPRGLIAGEIVIE